MTSTKGVTLISETKRFFLGMADLPVAARAMGVDFALDPVEEHAREVDEAGLDAVEFAEEDIVAEASGATVVFIMADNSEMYLENFKNAAK